MRHSDASGPRLDSLRLWCLEGVSDGCVYRDKKKKVVPLFPFDDVEGPTSTTRSFRNLMANASCEDWSQVRTASSPAPSQGEEESRGKAEVFVDEKRFGHHLAAHIANQKGKNSPKRHG